MRRSRLFTYAFLLALVMLLVVPALAAANGHPVITAVDDTQSYGIIQFVAEHPQAGAQFGYSVATDVFNTVVVGARYEDFDTYTDAGAVYVFSVDGLGNAVQVARLTAPDPSDGARFGQSVAVYEDTIVVGAPYDSTKGGSAGAAYVFAGKWVRWNFEQKIYASDAQANDRFGDAVATTSGFIGEGSILVGARGKRSDPADPSTTKTGAAYLFYRSGNAWTEGLKLTDKNGGPNQEFGASVALTPDGAPLVGAPGNDVTADTTGKVCDWEWDENAVEFTQRDDLSAPGLVAGDKFGSGLSAFNVHNEDPEAWRVGLVANTAGNLGGWPDAPKAYEYVRDFDTVPWTAVRVGTAASPGPMGAFTGSQVAFNYHAGYVGMSDFIAGGQLGSGAVIGFGNPRDLETGYMEPLTVPAPGVLANDFAITFPFAGFTGWGATAASQPAHGDLAMTEDGGFTYTPDEGFWGVDSFTYTASAGGEPSNTATVTITVDEPGTYTLEYAADPGGLIQGDAEQTVHQGFDGTPVTAVAEKGYEFVEWSDGLTTATRQDVDVQEDVSVTAYFQPSRRQVCLSAPIGYMKPAPWRWYTYAGTMSPKGKVGGHVVVVTVQRKVKGNWKAYRKYEAETVKFSNSQTKYVFKLYFKRSGAYRMRAALSTATQYGKSSFTYLRADWRK